MIPKCGNRVHRIRSDSDNFLKNDVAAGGKKGGQVDVKDEVSGQGNDGDLRYNRMQQEM